MTMKNSFKFKFDFNSRLRRWFSVRLLQQKNILVIIAIKICKSIGRNEKSWRIGHSSACKTEIPWTRRLFCKWQSKLEGKKQYEETNDTDAGAVTRVDCLFLQQRFCAELHGKSRQCFHIRNHDRGSRQCSGGNAALPEQWHVCVTSCDGRLSRRHYLRLP